MTKADTSEKTPLSHSHNTGSSPISTDDQSAGSTMTVCLSTLPGHNTRRLHQLAVALYSQEVGDLNVTPIQYSTLQTIYNNAGIDQKTLASTVGSDTATIGGVIDRLEARKLVTRSVAPHDRRVRLLSLTEKGEQTLEAVIPKMLASQTRFLAPLSPSKQKQFLMLVQELIKSNTDLSNTPTKD